MAVKLDQGPVYHPSEDDHTDEDPHRMPRTVEAFAEDCHGIYCRHLTFHIPPGRVLLSISRWNFLTVYHIWYDILEELEPELDL